MYKNGDENLGIFKILAFWHHLNLNTQKGSKREMRIQVYAIYILLRFVVVSCCFMMLSDISWCRLMLFLDVILFEALWLCLLSFSFVMFFIYVSWLMMFQYCLLYHLMFHDVVSCLWCMLISHSFNTHETLSPFRMIFFQTLESATLYSLMQLGLLAIQQMWDILAHIRSGRRQVFFSEITTR